MHNSVELWHSNSQILVPDRADKDTQSRLHFYLQWMTRQGRQWYEPALSEYCDWLLNSTTRRSRDGARLRTPLHPNTVTAHLSTIRTRYRRLLHHNPTVAFLAEQLRGNAAPAHRHTSRHQERHPPDIHSNSEAHHARPHGQAATSADIIRGRGITGAAGRHVDRHTRSRVDRTTVMYRDSRSRGGRPSMRRPSPAVRQPNCLTSSTWQGKQAEGGALRTAGLESRLRIRLAETQPNPARRGLPAHLPQPSESRQGGVDAADGQ